VRWGKCCGVRCKDVGRVGSGCGEEVVVFVVIVARRLSVGFCGDFRTCYGDYGEGCNVLVSKVKV